MTETTRIKAEPAKTGVAPEVGYDPGWTQSTWAGAAPEPTPPLTLLRQVRGGLRVFGFALFTLLLIPVFFAARAFGSERVVIRWWCGGCVRILGLRYAIKGAPIQGGALVANHAGWLDILSIGGAAPVHFVSKAEVAGWPFFGWIGKISNTVFIARKRSEAKAQEALLAQRAQQGQLLCLFPEGTSSDGQRVLPFKSALMSAFFARPDENRTATPVQALSIYYRAAPHLPRTFYGWWGRRGIFEHLWKVACLSQGGVAEMTFHPPLNPSEFTDRKALAQGAQALVASQVERQDRPAQGDAQQKEA